MLHVESSLKCILLKDEGESRNDIVFVTRLFLFPGEVYCKCVVCSCYSRIAYYERII